MSYEKENHEGSQSWIKMKCEEHRNEIRLEHKTFTWLELLGCALKATMKLPMQLRQAHHYAQNLSFCRILVYVTQVPQ